MVAVNKSTAQRVGYVFCAFLCKENPRKTNKVVAQLRKEYVGGTKRTCARVSAGGGDSPIFEGRTGTSFVH